MGSGPAGEQQARAILLAGTIEPEALAGASGWDGGRFAVWRPKRQRACGHECVSSEVGVIAFRWKQGHDPEEFGVAVPAYMIAGRLAERVNQRTWKVGDGYAALGTAHRASALAFAPSAALSQGLSMRAAAAASPRGR